MFAQLCCPRPQNQCVCIQLQVVTFKLRPSSSWQLKLLIDKASFNSPIQVWWVSSPSFKFSPEDLETLEPWTGPLLIYPGAGGRDHGICSGQEQWREKGKVTSASTLKSVTVRVLVPVWLIVNLKAVKSQYPQIIFWFEMSISMDFARISFSASKVEYQTRYTKILDCKRYYPYTWSNSTT